MITKKELIDLFANMEQNAPWDMSEPLLWGYYFADPAKDKLEAAAPVLAAQGYHVVGTFMSDKEDPADADLWWLHVEKVEKHTVDSLHLRNQLLYAFATTHQIDSYDGMDVGPVETDDD